jgi:hypothetical protein
MNFTREYQTTHAEAHAYLLVIVRYPGTSLLDHHHLTRPGIATRMQSSHALRTFRAHLTPRSTGHQRACNVGISTLHNPTTTLNMHAETSGVSKIRICVLCGCPVSADVLLSPAHVIQGDANTDHGHPFDTTQISQANSFTVNMVSSV